MYIPPKDFKVLYYIASYVHTCFKPICIYRYRQIPGDVCNGGENDFNTKLMLPCPNKSKSFS